MRGVSIAAVLLLLALILAACGNSARFDAGELLTADEVAAQRAWLEAQKSDDGDGEDDPSQEETPQNGIVFWLSGGSVYHLSKSCHHVREKEGVLQGTVDEALAAGKLRACSSCGKD